MTSSLYGNGLALLVLVWKTAYDVWWNPRRFKNETQGRESDLGVLRDAVTGKQNRSRTSTLITFALLAVSYLIFIVGEIHGF